MAEMRKTVPLALAAAGLGALFVSSWGERRRRRISFRGASVVITGGSRGLGLELARLFAAEGARLSLLARSRDDLERARRELSRRGAEVAIHPCDVREERQVDETVAAIVASRGRIDVLVNAAGVIQVAPWENQEVADFEESLAVHLRGPLFTARAVVPVMKRQGRGRIVNVSSIGGLVAVPHLLPYCAGKFALTGFSEGLRSELFRYGIVVTTVTPGLMRTGSHLNALFKGDFRKEFAWFALCSAIPLLSSDSRRAARRIVEGCRSGSARVIITLPATLLHLSSALFPGITAALMELTARFLPEPAENGGEAHSGAESRSYLAPRLLTRLADSAAMRNNEIDR